MKKQDPVILKNECSQIVVDDFIKAYCRNDLSVLVISGQPSQEQMMDAWNELYFEYASIIRTDESNHIFNLHRKITSMRIQCSYVDLATNLLKLQFLENCIDEDVVLQLQNFGYEIEITDDKEKWERQLNRIVSLCKTIKWDLADLEDEMKRLNNANSGKKQSETDFIQNVVMLQKWGYPVKRKETYMDEYAQAMNIYIKEAKQNSKNNGKETGK